MPVEIRELVIRAVALPEPKEAANDMDEEQLPQATESLDNKEMVIQECVRQVLRILRKEKER